MKPELIRQIRLSPSDSALDAWLLCKHGRRLPWIESQISSLDVSDENRRLLERWLDDVRIAHKRGDVELRKKSIEALLVGLKAAKVWVPKSTVGEKFTAGRKPGTPGPVRRAVAAYLKKHPKAKNPEIWDALKSAPPRGWDFYDNPQGQYVEHKDGATSRAQFNNICGQERKKIRS